MINDVVLLGRLTKDPELSTTASGLNYCRFTLAIDRNISKKNADQDTQTADFPNVVAWRGSAEFLCNYAHKGDRVSVVGRLQTRNYDKDDGTTVYVTEVVATHVALEESRQRAGGQGPVTNATQQDNTNIQPPTSNSASGGIDISDDELPF